jgi:hypothetical protein
VDPDAANGDTGKDSALGRILSLIPRASSMTIGGNLGASNEILTGSSRRTSGDCCCGCFSDNGDDISFKDISLFLLPNPANVKNCPLFRLPPFLTLSSSSSDDLLFPSTPSTFDPNPKPSPKPSPRPGPSDLRLSPISCFLVLVVVYPPVFFADEPLGDPNPKPDVDVEVEGEGKADLTRPNGAPNSIILPAVYPLEFLHAPHSSAPAPVPMSNPAYAPLVPRFKLSVVALPKASPRFSKDSVNAGACFLDNLLLLLIEPGVKVRLGFGLGFSDSVGVVDRD